MTVEKILFALFRSEICGETLLDEYKKAITPETASALYSISKSHDLAHLVCEALDKNGVLAQCGKELEEAFCQQRQLAVCRYEQMKYEYARICKTFEDAKIKYMPLKGAIIRVFYPQPWLRTSCDIDVLIEKEELNNAIKALTEKLDYKITTRTAHDVSLFSGGGVHLELHHDLIENEEKMQVVLSKVWETSKRAKDRTYCYEMNDETFYFYHLAHMAKHFLCGGCGIKPFIDLWILECQIPHDEKARDALIELGGLQTLNERAKTLCQVWFEGQEHDDVTKQMEMFVLSGGVYGNLENRVAVQQQKKGGKIRYAFSRIFLPYDEIKVQYPVLENKKWLLPFCQVRRWVRLIFKGRVGHSVRELNVNAGISQERQQVVEMLLQNLGL